MDEARKRAYRYMLYYAMLNIRMNIPCGPYSRRYMHWWSPAFWYRVLRRHRYNMALADALHNLAQFSADDFRDFDESMFWKGYERFHRRFGDKWGMNLRSIFDKVCAGKV